eukprot:CAMPEP_0173100222 /NCGR_PEP_ID=MMETSP1102-20130122/36062_1 /TAXON_ID=49646 /ORGANISM="Geminigera sp., Strain Caron Lab Isolate" /LENGTH=191 /DNA_ID=CAMNT_0013993597 /DNA_START=60 /DNA_END=635 /DNA_ORIENTATION=+
MASEQAAEDKLPNAPYEIVKDEPGGDAQWSSGICDCFGDVRNCMVACVPGLNFFSLGQSFVVMEGKESISDEPICGVMLPACASLGMCVEYVFSAWTVGNLGACVHFFISCPQLMVLRLKFFEAPHNIQPCRCCGVCDCPAWVDACCCSFWCWWCALCQIQRHMQTIKLPSKGAPYLFAPEATNAMGAKGE